MQDYRIIVAMDQNRLIGKSNKLPWRIPEDLAFFRKQTLGHNVVMGMKTWLSLGKPLEDRINIVLTKDKSFSYSGIIVVHSLSELEQWLEGQYTQNPYSKSQNYIIGGAQVFTQFLGLSTHLYITRIECVFQGDTYFPDYPDSDWDLVGYESKITHSGIQISFNHYTRKGRE